MWKLFKFIAATVKAIVWLALIAAVAALVALYLLERGLPAPLVRRLEDACSGPDLLCRIERATFSLKGGLRFRGVKLFPKRTVDTALFSAEEAAIDVSLQPGIDLSRRLRHITLKNVSFPTLPSRSHHPAPAASVPVGPADTHDSPVVLKAPRHLRLPSVETFCLTVENADILGLQISRITAQISLQPSRAAVTQVVICWPDTAFPMTVSGGVTIDLDRRLVDGTAKGQTFPANILPLLTALRARGAVKQLNCFSKLARPVDADAVFQVDMDNSDFVLNLGLTLGDCEYQGVPMRTMKGTLRAYGTNIYTTVDIGPLAAESATGPLSGRLVYREEGESLELDATASMDINHLTAIMTVLNEGQLKPIRCETPPRVTARGLLALNSRISTVTNSLRGTIAFDDGSVFNLRVKDVTADLEINGYTARLDRVSGISASGGKVTGEIAFAFPNYSATSTMFTAKANFSNLDLSDFTPVFRLTNTRAGTMSARVTLDGRASERTIPTLSGEGHLSIRNGLLHRLPLFAGFTDYLAANIPGVSALVNQSSGSMNFTISNGVLRSENVLVEGDLFGMQGRGACDLDSESLDFVVRANIFREKTFAGRLTRLVTLPFSRLLLEFKLSGTLKNPEWQYVSIIERITEGLGEWSGPRKAGLPAPTPDAPEQTP